ncbi:MBL fold metallo-hydrolase [Amycolatopsis regifaucium]|uniref:Metallo-beta-lactamase domain-containing protein n=1 Tax=Amycolatopsis regifaucium TaxID=546365 RepID=A0ABX3E2N4_9PSEU|nr:MBL fold metallo-hydrolase [Amycolatopsis regifaucium]OKA11394.1 hypothetical protein ATP06_0200600 [Amycolatopsis regifaucium]SFH42965.1 Glyoxylase, beta-lactamase superfamily II [Amycolatopsis regifaucium]
MDHRLRRFFAAGLAAVCVAGCSPDDTPATPEARPERFASPNPGSVNTYWIPVPDGLVVVDTLRTPDDARRAVAEIRKTGKPVAAILLTHSHPDHVGGASAFHEAFPRAPIFASRSTDRAMREDKRGFYPLARSANPNFPATLTYADRTFEDGSPVQAGGIGFETATFADGESDTATVYHRTDTGDLYSGDLATGGVTPALIEGDTCGWLGNLDRLSGRFPGARTMYPGHGAPGQATALIDEQRDYLRRFRAFVRPAVTAQSAGGTTLVADEEKSIIAELERAFPGRPPVADLPTIVAENVKAVARELAGPGPACPAEGDQLLEPVRRYVDAVNSGDLDALAGVFAADAELVDVGRRFTGRAAIRDWAGREVVGGKLTVTRIDENRPGYQRLLVRFAPGGNGGFSASYAFTVAGSAITRAELTYAG